MMSMSAHIQSCDVFDLHKEIAYVTEFWKLDFLSGQSREDLCVTISSSNLRTTFRSVQRKDNMYMGCREL